MRTHRPQLSRHFPKLRWPGRAPHKRVTRCRGTNIKKMAQNFNDRMKVYARGVHLRSLSMPVLFIFVITAQKWPKNGPTTLGKKKKSYSFLMGKSGLSTWQKALTKAEVNKSWEWSVWRRKKKVIQSSSSCTRFHRVSSPFTAHLRPSVDARNGTARS